MLFPSLIVLLGILAFVASDTCSVSDANKVDCGYAGIDENSCVAKGCCWSPAGTNSVTPWCYKQASGGYTLTNFVPTSYGFEGSLTLKSSSSSTAISKLRLQVVYESSTVFRLRITDDKSSRWEVPQSVVDRPTPEEVEKVVSTAYSFKYNSDPFTFEVIRNSDGASIFRNSNPITFEDQYIVLSTDFDSNAKTYGLGESTRLNHALNTNQIYTMWASDTPSLIFNTNLYGSFPYYMQVLNGQAYGAMVMNSNGIDASLKGSSLTFTMIGGMIDLYVFVGPSAPEVIQQYTSVVGRPAMMPYWSLGFHNCKYGYTSLSQVQDVVAGYANAGIPLETQWMDIDYMQNYRDFTYDSVNFPVSQVKTFVDKLHANGQHFVPIIDPGIMTYSGYDAYEQGVKKNLFVKDIQGNNYLGQVWPGPTYFPDFFNPDTYSYWAGQLQSFYDMTPVDGIWIDMNEVSNFCNDDGRGQVCVNDAPSGCPAPGASQTDCCLSCHTVDSTNKLDFPPYAIHNNKGNLATKTMAMSATHYNNITVYNAHNLYGLTEMIATSTALAQIRKKRPFVLTRSSFMSTGKYGAKWTGDNQATWDDLKSSIISLFDFNMFGIPMIGADICGFIGDTTEELCARWIEVGAFYPFSRDHNTLGAKPQELYLWSSVTTAAKFALGIKYQLLPYYYTLFYQAHSTGSTVIRPMLMNFPDDSATLNVISQFMVGSGILITPVVTQGATSVTGYFPQGYWYNFVDRYLQYDTSSHAAYNSINTPLTSTNVHLYGGNIIPLQDAEMTTVASRQTPFTLLAGLCTKGGAYGSLFWDDGEQIDVTNYIETTYKITTNAIGGTLTTTVVHNNYETSNVIGQVVVMGTNALTWPKTVTLNNKSFDSTNVSFDYSKNVLTFKNLNVKVNEYFTLSWEY